MDGLVNLFGRDPFQEFANKRFKELMSQDSMKQLIQMREQALEVRHKAHIESINKMFENRKFSPRTFQNKKIELEKWVNKERDNIQKSRKDIEKGWTSTQDSIKKTQRDLEFLNKVAAHSGSKSSAQKIDERSIEPSNRTATKDLTRSPIAKFILPEDSIQSESSKKNREEEPGLRYIDDIQLELRSPPGEKKTPNKFSPSARSASKYDTIKSDSSYPGTRTEDLTIDTTELGNKEIRSRKPIGSPHIESDNTGSSKYLNQSESVIETTNVGFDNKFISSRLSTQKEDKPLEIPSRISPQNANKAKERRNKLAPLEPEGHEAAVVSLTPKTPQELRNLFNEQVEALKASTSNPDLTQKVLEEAGKQTSQKALETVDVEVNLQKKVDMITEEVFNCLFDELGKELGKPEKERVAGKVKGIDDHNPVLGKQQLADNKEFFTHGAEKHHNFQANIPIIPAAIVEHEKLDEVHDIIKEEERIYDELERYENLYDQGVIRENNSSQPIKSDEQERLLDDDQIKQQHQQQQVLFDTQAEIFRNLAIKTDLKSLENYLDMLLAEIKGTYMDEFLTNINIPIGLNIGEKLNNMHAYDLAGSESSLEMSDGLQRAILSIHLYLKVEEALMEQNPSRNEVITELEHIHNKMVFDCLNEILDFYRPHGLVGEPYPWKLSVRVQKPATIIKSHVERILRECKKKVMEWAAFMCGYYGERDDFIRDRTNSYAEEYLAQIKEERLSKMLAAEVYEMEDKWINYDDEEAEVELEISDLVFDKLVTETAELIMRINEQRGGPKRPSPERKLKIQQDDKKRRKKSL